MSRVTYGMIDHYLNIVNAMRVKDGLHQLHYGHRNGYYVLETIDPKTHGVIDEVTGLTKRELYRIIYAMATFVW